MKTIIEKLSKQFNVTEITPQRPDLFFVTVPEKEAVSFITCLRDSENFSHLVFITAVDYIESSVFQLTYMLHNYEKKLDMGVRVKIDRNHPVMDSIHHLWAHAATYQRELKEMFGIDFPGSPGVDEPLLLEGWQEIPPMRRDFDTKAYVERTYFPRPGRKSYDPREFMKSRLYPDPEGDAT